MASVAVKSNTAANSTGTDEKGTAKAADLVFEDDDFEEFPGEWVHIEDSQLQGAVQREFDIWMNVGDYHLCWNAISCNI